MCEPGIMFNTSMNSTNFIYHMEADSQLLIFCGMLSGPWCGIRSLLLINTSFALKRSSLVSAHCIFFSIPLSLFNPGELENQDIIFSLAEWSWHIAREGLKKNKSPSRCSWKTQADKHMGSSDSQPSVKYVREISHLEVRKTEALLNYVSRECY